jgi:uncharacterized protein YutE (UPF0331/DUF86 family)
MVKPEVVRRKVSLAAFRLEKAEKLLSQPSEEFLADEDQQDLASFHLLLAIQECIDLAAHWISDEGWPPPQEAASLFDVLADHKAIDRALAVSLRQAISLRNRISHGYSSVDHERIQVEYQTGVADLRRFLSAVATEAGL